MNRINLFEIANNKLYLEGKLSSRPRPIKAKKTFRMGNEDMKKSINKAIKKYIDEGGTDLVLINNASQSILYCKDMKKLIKLHNKIATSTNALTIEKGKRKEKLKNV